MKPSYHVIISSSLGLGMWFFLKSLPAAIICFSAGVFTDIDHVLEYVINFGWKGFSLKKCYRECEYSAVRSGRFKFRKLYLILHAVELGCIFWLFAFYTRNIYVFALAIGYFSHIILDMLGNQEFMSFYFYFFAWRAYRKFRTAKIMSRMVVEKNGL